MIDDMVSRGWTLVKWGVLLTVMVVAVAVPYFYHRVDETIRKQVEARFRGHYRNLSVSLRSARLVKGEGIEIRGLSIREPGSAAGNSELVYVDEAFLKCNTDLDRLIGDDVDISRIVIRRPTLRATLGPAGESNLSQLLPVPKFGKASPEVVIENGMLEIHDPSQEEPRQFTVRDADLVLSPKLAVKNESDKRRLVEISGRATGDYVREAAVQGWLSLDELTGELNGTIGGLKVCPELVRALPAAWLHGFSFGESLRADVEARFSLTCQSRAPWRFDVTGKLREGRVEDARLPYPITKLQSDFRFTPEFCEAKRAVAQSGPSRLTASVRLEGYSASSPMTCRISARNLVLDDRLQEVLPAAWQDQWSNFRPAGEVDVDMTLDSDGAAWRRRVVLTCRDVAFTYHRFRYRLEHTKGQIDIRDDVLTLKNFEAYAEGRRLNIACTAHLPLPASGDYVEIEGDRLNFSEKMFAALPEPSRDAIRSLNPRGQFDLYLHFVRGEGAQAPLDKSLRIKLRRCSLQYENFRYPLDDVQGFIDWHDDVWTFSKLEGVNDTARVSAEGSLEPDPAGSRFALRLHGDNVPLDDELREALPASGQAVWAELQPHGNVRIDASITKISGQPHPAIEASVGPVAEGESRPLSIEPRQFPYRLDIRRGEFKYYDLRTTSPDDVPAEYAAEFAEFRQAATFEGVEATHGQTEIRASGCAGSRQGGGWSFHIRDGDVDGLRPERDRDLLEALPSRLRTVLASLHPSGSTNFTGELDLFGGGASPLRADWDLQIELSGASLTAGVDLTDIHGGVSLAGGYDGASFHSRGELDLDSVSYRGFQCTRVMGPLWLDDRVALLGAPASKKLQLARPRYVTCDFYGGTAYGDGKVVFDQGPSFAVDVHLAGVDLRRFTHEAIDGPQNFTGLVTGDVSLGGNGPGLHNLYGQGRLALRQAEVRDLPLVIALLDSLSGRRRQSLPFHTSDVAFQLKGEYIYLNRIRLTSDAVTLIGEGEVGLDKRVDMKFYSLMGRDEWRIPIVSDLAGGASQQILEIAVGGTLDEPRVEQQILPAVRELLDRLQTDLQGTASAPASQPADVAGRSRQPNQ